MAGETAPLAFPVSRGLKWSRSCSERGGMGFCSSTWVSGCSLVGGRTLGALDQQGVFPSVPKDEA